MRKYEILEHWLEYNVSFVEARVPDLKPNTDIAPMLVVSHKDDADFEIILPTTRNWFQDNKAQAITCFRELLRARQADRYAIVWPAWIIAVSLEEKDAAEKEIAERGSTGTQWEARRREIIVITVGDKSRSLTQDLAVTRNPDGFITGLERGPIMSSHEMYGRMIDLLVEQH